MATATPMILHPNPHVVRSTIMRRFLIATALALGWMVSPWLVGAEGESYVSRMYDAMEWCLPSDTFRQEASNGPQGVEWMWSTSGPRPFALMMVPPDTYIELINVKHPQQQFLRIGVPVPNRSDPGLDEQRIFTLMISGCFVLTQPPTI